MVPVGLAGLAPAGRERYCRCAASSASGVKRPARRGRGLDQHRLAAERGQNVPIRRIAGIGQRDPVARLEQGEERKNKAAGRTSGHHDARRIELKDSNCRRSGGRCGPAATECPAPRYSRCGPGQARRAPRPSRARRRRAGWPTSICMTRPPGASIRAAAAITSMTMNGGTLLRAEGVSSRFAIPASWLFGRFAAGPAPLLPYSTGFLGRRFS